MNLVNCLVHWLYYSQMFSSIRCVYLLSTLFSSFLTVLLSVCVLFLSGGASVILSLGLTSWCDTVTNQNMQPFRYTMNNLIISRQAGWLAFPSSSFSS